jgi:glutathione-regulated potassium-efflux system ancillary protein KefF
MRFLPPMMLHGAHGADAARIAAHVAAYRERVLGYPNWPEMDGLDACPSCEMPAADRPGRTAAKGLTGSEAAA